MALLQLGYNMYTVLALIYKQLIQPRPDFMELVLHHFCTCLILGIGYPNDQLKNGAVILLAHNWSDITVAMCKCASELHFNNVFIGVCVTNIILFFWTRIYVFATLIHTCYVLIPVEEMLGRLKFESDRQSFLRCLFVSRILISVIYILQVYWFVTMINLMSKVFGKQSEVKGDKVPDNLRLLSQVNGNLLQSKE